MFFPSNPELFFTKNDPEDVRLGDLFKNFLNQTPQENDYCLLGYPDDEGIRLNGGRVGSAFAPQMIRQFLYKMTPESKTFKTQFLDFGDLAIKDKLQDRHSEAYKKALWVFEKKCRLITFGGGHDYGFSDASAFIDSARLYSNKKPVIINFDAHLDVRPVKDQNFNSGTPFYRLLEKYPHQFHFLEIGIQPQCNSIDHRDWALSKGVEIIDCLQIAKNGWSWVWTQPTLTKLLSDSPVFVSFDIDVLSASEAGGASQSWNIGLTSKECLLFLNQLYNSAHVRGLGIYEVSPPLDRDFQTSKSAALIAHQFIFNNLRKF